MKFVFALLMFAPILARADYDILCQTKAESTMNQVLTKDKRIHELYHKIFLGTALSDSEAIEMISARVARGRALSQGNADKATEASETIQRLTQSALRRQRGAYFDAMVQEARKEGIQVNWSSEKGVRFQHVLHQNKDLKQSQIRELTFEDGGQSHGEIRMEMNGLPVRLMEDLPYFTYLTPECASDPQFKSLDGTFYLMRPSEIAYMKSILPTPATGNGKPTASAIER